MGGNAVLGNPTDVTAMPEVPRRGVDAPRSPGNVYWTPQQVAEMLQVHERTVLRWAAEDASMPATRIGRVIRFEREPLLRWLARKRPRSAQRSTQTDNAAS